ncbi:trichohyalin-like [Thalassophryne amazonica]|uniref:trichohyalin-like n=1 Tax=Thalassophryne amazonica TaxID=390379 RepID=UPI001470CB09|nr:trichohyalin-like [Thalassophryne amazonica]
MSIKALVGEDGDLILKSEWDREPVERFEDGDPDEECITIIQPGGDKGVDELLCISQGMRFPVDILADVSHEELERSSLIYMNKLLYSNPDFPEYLRLTDTTQMPIQSSNVGLIPLYRYNNQHKLLALFPPTDLFTAVAFYLLDQWWTLEDIVKTADPARDGVVQVETVGERIVLYILNRWIYKETEMNTDELPFLCHTEKDYAKILWKDGAAVGFYSVKPSGVSFESSSTRTYQLPVMDSLFVRKCHRGHSIGLYLLEDFVHSFKEDYLGLKYPLSVTMYKVCGKYLSKYPEYADVLWEVERTGTPAQRTNIANKIRTMDLRAVTKTLSFTEEPLVTTEGTTADVVTEVMTTRIHDPESLECSGWTMAVLSIDSEEKCEWVFDQSLDDATATDIQSSDHDSLLTSNLEKAAVTTAGAGETDAPLVDLDNSQSLHKPSFDTHITVEIVASEIEGVDEESQTEKTAVHLIPADSLDTDEGVEVLDQTDEGTKVIACENDSKESDKTCDKSHIPQVVSGGVKAGKTAVKVKKRAQSETPRRRSQQRNKSPSIQRETSRQSSVLILRGRTIVRTPTPKRQYVSKDQKIRKNLEKGLDEFEASPVRKGQEREVALENEANKQSGVAVQEFAQEKPMEEKQQQEAEQLTNEEKMETREEPERQDALLDEPVAEPSDVKPEEDINRTGGDELEKAEKQAQEHRQEAQEVEKMERELSVEELTAGVKEFIKNVTLLTEENEEEKPTEGMAESTNVLEVEGDDTREESETAPGRDHGVSTTVSPSEVQEEANFIIEPAAAAQETDITSQIHEVQKKAVVVSVDLKTTYYHLQLKASEETSAAREQIEKEQLDVTAAQKVQTSFGSSAVEDQSSESENIEETSLSEMAEPLIVEEKELGEEKLANVDNAKSDAAIPVVIETKALRGGRKTVRPGGESLSRAINLKADKGTGTTGEEDEAKTAAIPVEGDIVKDGVTEQDTAENLQTTGSKTFADTEMTIPVPEDMNKNLFSGEVTRADEDEAQVVEKRQLRSGTKIITPKPTPKSTRSKEQDQDQDKETVDSNAEEELQGKISTLTQVGMSTSVTPEDKLTKPREEESQMEEEESLTAEQSGPLSQCVSIEIVEEKLPAVAEEAILGGSTITEQSAGPSETFGGLKASAEGTSLEEELPQQEHLESEGGVSLEKNIDDEETRTEIIGAKSDVGREEEPQKECEEKKESTSEEADVQKEETRLTTTKQQEDKREETPEEEDKIKGGTEGKCGDESELETVKIEAVMSDDTKEKTSRNGAERDTDEMMEVEQMGTILVIDISDTAGVTSSQCQESPEQEQESKDAVHQVCNLKMVTVALDDRSKDDHEVQEESAAVECQVVLEKTADVEEEQKDLTEEETKSKEQVPETPVRETEVVVSTVEEKRFDKKVTDDVTTQDSVEGKQSVAWCDEVVTLVEGAEMIWTTSEDEQKEPQVHIRVLRSVKKSITERQSTTRAHVHLQGEKNNEKEEPVTREDKEAEMKQGRENAEDEEAHFQERRESEVEAELISIVETQKDAGEVGQCEVCVEKVEPGHARSAEEDLPSKVSDQNKKEAQDKEQGEESAEDKGEEQEKTSTWTLTTKPPEEEDQMEEEESVTPAGVSEEFRELKTSTEGSDSEEEELPPVVETRAQRGGRKRIRSPTKYRSRRGTKVNYQNTQGAQHKEQSGDSAENKEVEAHKETSTLTQGGTPTCGREDESTKPNDLDQMEEEESTTEVRSQDVTLENKDKEITENTKQESGPKKEAITREVIVEKVTAVAEKGVSEEAELEKKQDAVELGHCDISVEGKDTDHAVSRNAEDQRLSKEAEEAGEDSTSASASICEITETAAIECAEEDTPQKEAIITETRVLRSGGKTVQREKASINQQEKDKEDTDTCGNKSAEEEEITEKRILRKGRKPTPAAPRPKSKRGRIQHQEEEEDESSPGEKAVGKEDVLELETDQTEQTVEEVASGENEEDTEPGIETVESVGEESDTLEQKQFVLSEELPKGQEETSDGEKATNLLSITQTEEDRVDKRERKDTSATETEGKKDLDKSKDHKETAVAEQGQAFPGKSAEDDRVEPFPEEQETNFSEIRLLRSGTKAVKTGQASTNQQQKDKQDPGTAEDKGAEEDEVIEETRILRKGRKSAPTPSSRKSKRARVQRQEEEEEQTAMLDSSEEKDTEEETKRMLKEEEKPQIGKEQLTEHVESMTREEEDNSAVVCVEKAGLIEGALSEDVSPTESEEMKTSVAAVEATVPGMIEEPSDEVEGTSKSVEGSLVIAKDTTATAMLHEECIEQTQAEDASAVTVEQAQAATSGKYRRQKDQIEAEQQQEEGKPEQEETRHLAEFPGIVHEAEESSSTGKEAEPLAKYTVEENFDEPADVVTMTEKADKNIESPEEALPERKEGTTTRTRRITLPVASGTKSKDTEEPQNPKQRSLRRSHWHRGCTEGDRLEGETDAANEEDDDEVELHKTENKDEDEEAKCSADAQTQMMEENVQDYSRTSETSGEDADILTLVLDSDQETEKTGMKGEDDQSMSEEENEPIVIRKRVLRGRTIPSLVVSSKGKRAEDTSSNDDWEQNSHLAQTRCLRKRKSTEATPTRQSKRHSRV